MEITWRDVLDCKRAGTAVGDITRLAEELGYKFVCHNDRIFSKVILRQKQEPEECWAELKNIKIENIGK